jgi:hypothetical protein
MSHYDEPPNNDADEYAYEKTLDTISEEILASRKAPKQADGLVPRELSGRIFGMCELASALFSISQDGILAEAMELADAKTRSAEDATPTAYKLVIKSKGGTTEEHHSDKLGFLTRLAVAKTGEDKQAVGMIFERKASAFTPNEWFSFLRIDGKNGSV